MTELGKLYGGALYELAEEQSLTAELLEQTAVLDGVFSDSPDFIKLLCTPSLKKEDRTAIVEESFGGKIEPILLNFLKVLTEKGLMREFPHCVKEYRGRYNEAHNIEEVTAITAVPLSEALCGKLSERLRSVTGKDILLHNRVEPSVMGGIRIEMAGRQIDGTVRSKLEGIRSSLLEIIA
ncbi:MAG: ATP synthase F1 subunit delta [Oscillospiraceae bacterium]|nr:ATP synthase F1 subunit delta [Oscillospiraceae bacterium]MDY4190695.1 ATP synthase F1 subunit delta [Oscillospiraceae bacterium]